MKTLYLLLAILIIFMSGCENKEYAPDDTDTTKEKFVLIESEDFNDK